jgi:hypothetical protein
MKTIIHVASVSIILSIVSCKEAPQEPPPPPDPRDELTGIFEMTKLENGQVYLMKVEKMGELCNWCDSLRYTNYGDMFNFENIRIPYLYWNNYLNIGIHSPITDKYGRRWQLSCDGYNLPPDNYNMILNDSLKIRFKISNVQYYLEDGVPRVFDSVITHVGKRIAKIE